MTAAPDGRLVVEPGAGRSAPTASWRCRGRSGRRCPASPTTCAGSCAATATARSTAPRRVWAAGDAIAFPVKQGGLAAQQADAVAEAIAARAGADVRPQPFRPVLRGVLLTGRGQAWMRSAPGGGGEGEAERRALFWPPTKIAGRYISPYLAELDRAQAIGEAPQPDGQPVELDLGVPVDAEHALEPRQEHLHRV